MLRIVLATFVLLLTGCDGAATITTSTTTSSPATTASAPPTTPDALTGFGRTTVMLDGTRILVAVADDSDKRRQGLMSVTDLGDLDGMLFVFDSDVTAGFWMKDTIISLDIVFFTDTGSVVGRFVMEPCEADPCTVYRPAGAYRYALEMPAGAMPAGVTHITFDR
jgi:uncharacterized protein